jgi:hypothetical protein
MNSHSNLQNICLIASKFSYVFNVVLKLAHQTRYIGRLDQAGEGTFTTKRSEKHLHRKTNSLGVNLELLQRFNFKWIVIDYCGKKLETTRNFLLYHGSVFDFKKAGFEKQCFLKLNLFGRDKAEAFDRTILSQGDLFSQAA